MCAEGPGAKRLIWEGFQRAVSEGAPKEFSGILVDDQYGPDVAREAKAGGYQLSMPVEKSLTGCAIERAYVDKGYRGHDAQNPRRVFISGQRRGVFGVIKRELRRRSAIEPIIGHLKAEGHLGRCYLKGRAGDAANVVLSAVGHNFRRILAWLRDFWRLILTALIAVSSVQSALRSAS